MEEKDGSYFFLLEDSADSELDKIKWHQDQRVSGEDDQEDAQSCSCGHDDTSERSSLDFQDDGDEEADDLNGLRPSDPPRSCLTMSFSGAAAGREYETTEEEESSNVGVIHDMNEMVQMEDKLFWEACMAGGYP